MRTRRGGLAGGGSADGAATRTRRRTAGELSTDHDRFDDDLSSAGRSSAGPDDPGHDALDDGFDDGLDADVDELDELDDDLVIPRLSWSRDELGAWLRWVGLWRVVTAAGVVLVAIAVGWWLLRPPPLPTEAVLPRATTTQAATGQATAGQSATGQSPTDQSAGNTVATGPGAAPEAAPTPPPVPSTVAVSLLVHVAGAVVRPGVVVVPTDARVADAVAAAGGAARDGDVDRLNLAAPLGDGDRVEVPVRGAPVDGVATLHQSAVAPSATTGEPALVDLNHADAAALETLPGVGAATAAAILEYRATNGPFAGVDDLELVTGIGPAKLERLRPLVTV